jgi:hypothetical protein
MPQTYTPAHVTCALRTADQAAEFPDPIAEAVTSPYAWQRLSRFAAAIAHQTLNDAAAHLGVAQATLVTQISRLERDIGGTLLECAERGRSRAPTPLGEQILATLRQSGRLAERTG